MEIKLRFLGAAENVTGSRHLLEADGKRILVDCGLYQERSLRERNWDPFVVGPESIDAVLLTHAHLDHCGLLPKLVREGFKGRVYCTDATAEIARIVMLDCAHIQEEDAEYKRRRHRREKRKPPRAVVALYSTEDARACEGRFSTVKYKQTVSIADGIEATFYDAGHILGASMIKVKVDKDAESRTILFSGDIGRAGRPILQDPTVFDEADYVLVESTYGERVHGSVEDVKDTLADAINATKEAGGNIAVPSFSIERAQEILYYLNELLLENRIPHLMTFLDSPMAVRVTEVFKEHPEMFDDEMKELLDNHESPFSFSGLKMVRSTRESKAINHIRGTVMIIAGSGMCTGGRIKHHLINNISRPESTVLFVGYQAFGTLGREILGGAEEVRILGQKCKVRARIVQVHGFSAHADRDELVEWLGNLKKAPRRVFVVHGEKEVAHSFGDYLSEKTGWEVVVPKYRDEITLD